jgi:GT2 family glycosyltransferase
MALSVVIPTMTGREADLERAVTAYQLTTNIPWELVLVKDAPSWSKGCNEGFRRARYDIIHFSADDLEAQPGWHDDALALLERDELPAPRVLNFSADGEMDNWADGFDGQETHFTRIPLMTRSQYERIGVWPEIDYASDIWVSEKARFLGIKTRMVYSYCFVHHWSQVKRTDSPKAIKNGQDALVRLRREMRRAHQS